MRARVPETWGPDTGSSIREALEKVTNRAMRLEKHLMARSIGPDLR